MIILSRPERYRPDTPFLEQPEMWPEKYWQSSLGLVDPRELHEAARAAVVSVATAIDTYQVFTVTSCIDTSLTGRYGIKIPKPPLRSGIFMARNMRPDLVDSFDEGLLGHICRVAQQNQINYLAGVRIFQETDPDSIHELPYSQIVLAKCLGSESHKWLAPEETEYMTLGQRLSLLALGPRFFEAAQQEYDDEGSKRVARVVGDLLIQKFLT